MYISVFYTLFDLTTSATIWISLLFKVIFKVIFKVHSRNYLNGIKRVYILLFFFLSPFLTKKKRKSPHIPRGNSGDTYKCFMTFRLRISRSPQNLINESPEFSLVGTSPYLKFRI